MFTGTTLGNYVAKKPKRRHLQRDHLHSNFYQTFVSVAVKPGVCSYEQDHGLPAVWLTGALQIILCTQTLGLQIPGT